MAAKHLLKETADCKALHSQIDDRTMEPWNEKSQIAEEYGLLPADAGSNYRLDPGLDFRFWKKITPELPS